MHARCIWANHQIFYYFFFWLMFFYIHYSLFFVFWEGEGIFLFISFWINMRLLHEIEMKEMEVILEVYEKKMIVNYLKKWSAIVIHIHYISFWGLHIKLVYIHVTIACPSRLMPLINHTLNVAFIQCKLCLVFCFCSLARGWVIYLLVIYTLLQYFC